MSKAIEPSMLLITATWQGFASFKLMPASKDCPYTECLFDPTAKIFVVISKDTKTSFHMVNKLDENGDPMVLKVKPRDNGKNVKEQRVTMTTFIEHYMDNMDDVKAFIKLFAVNEGTFKYEEILDKPKQQMETPSALL